MVEQATIPEWRVNEQRFPISAWNKELAFQFLTSWEIIETESNTRWMLYPKRQDTTKQHTNVWLDFRNPDLRMVTLVDQRKKDGDAVSDSSLDLIAPAEFIINPDSRAAALEFYVERNNPNTRLSIYNDGRVIGVSSNGSSRAIILTEPLEI